MRAFPACCCLAGLLILFCQGACSNGRSYDRAQKAEQAGRYHQAYDRYCDTARDKPGSGSVADSIERVRPHAVAYWEARAAQTVEEGRYADGWKMWMRVLNIQPDHKIAAARILELQEQHAVAVRSAREDWRSRGFRALAVREPDRKLDREPELEEPYEAVASRTGKEPPSGEQQFAMATPGRDANPPTSYAEQIARVLGTEEPQDPVSLSAKVASAPRGRREMAGEPQKSVSPAAGEGSMASYDVQASSLPDTADLAHADESSEESAKDVIRAVPKGSIGGDQSRVRKEAVSIGVSPVTRKETAIARPSRLAGPVTPPSPPMHSPKTSQARRPRLILPVPQEPPLAERPSPSSLSEAKPKSSRKTAEPESSGHGEFIVLRTLSRKDHRYPRSSELLDGVNAKLKDTDGDLDADFNLYIRDKRIKKIRELSVGRSSMFRGKSGKHYMLTVLSVHHRTHTVRIGIRPA